LEAEFGEFSGKPGEAGTFYALELTRAEVGIKDAACEQRGDDGDDSGDDDSLAPAASYCEPGEEGTKITALLAACRPGELDAHGLERRLPLASDSGRELALTRAI
jgi:hypothetical protein